MHLNIAIIGYGMAGVAAALHCRDAGHRVTHFERNKQPSSSGAGMLLHPPAQQQLRQLGVLDQALECGSQIRNISALTSDSQPLLNFSYKQSNNRRFGLGIQRAALFQILANADTGYDDVVYGANVTDLDVEHGVLVADYSIRYGPFDLIIIADGTNSLLRENIQTGVIDRKTPKNAALVGLLDDPDRMINQQLTQYFKGGRHLSLWPVGSFSPGAINKCSFAINIKLSEEKSLRRSNTWQATAKTLFPAISSLFEQQQSEVQLHTFTYRQVEMKRCVKGRAVIIGDASHSMSPQLGNGVQLALQDAALLATQIQQSSCLETALSKYNLTRTKQLRPYHHASRLLTPLFQSDSKTIALLRKSIFTRLLSQPKIQNIAHELLG